MIFTMTGESSKFTGLIHKNKGEDWQEVEPKDYKITDNSRKIEYLGNKGLIQPTYTTDWKKVYDSKVHIPDHIVEEVNKEKPDIVKRIENDQGKIIQTSQRIGENCLFFSDFVKNDQDKIQPNLIEPEFIEGMAKVLTLGAKKYGKDNWKKCQDKDRYKDALLRHILAYLKGEEKDQETNLSHLYHAACNLMFLEYLHDK